MFIRIPFPLQGINTNWAVTDQPILTSADLQNVRAYSVQENRIRGGQRPGLKIAYGKCIGFGNPVVAICSLTMVV